MLEANGMARLGTPPPRRILVLRALQLGDLLCAIPALRALRGALPDAEIVLLGLPWARSFVERFSSYLDGFLEFPGFPGLPERPPDLGRIPSFLAEVQRMRFDLALQMHGSGSFVNPLTVLFGARHCAGFHEPGGYCPDPFRFLPYPDRGLELRRLLRLVEFLGVPTRGEELEFLVHEEDQRRLRGLDGASLLRRGEYVCIHPGASVPERRWPASRFAAVADILSARGLYVVLTGTAGERPLTQEVARGMRAASLDLAGRTELGSLAALLSESRLLVSNDTGVAHLADALGVPSVILSTGRNPERWAPVDRVKHRVLCRASGVEAAEVVAQARDLLDGEAAGASEARKSDPSGLLITSRAGDFP
jgi:ADP-heptose:LPS heptosyltransferase